MAFFPLGDDNKTRRIDVAKVTWGLMALCLFSFVYQESLRGDALYEYIFGFGFVPALLTGSAELPADMVQAPAWLTLITYQFLHGDWGHLLGNMLFLWIFGDNVEDAMGHWRFLAFYLITGAMGALAHFSFDMESTSPLIGASGAISGVLGAYLLLHPFARIIVLVVAVPLRVPAWVMLLVWIGFQFVALSDGQDKGVAFLAHIGGFAAGMILVPFFKGRDVPLFARKDSYVAAPHRLVRRPRAAPSGGQLPPEAKPPEKGPWG